MRDQGNVRNINAVLSSWTEIRIELDNIRTKAWSIYRIHLNAVGGAHTQNTFCERRPVLLALE